MKNESFIELKGINKYFSGNHVLKDVDFELRKGEIHALMGENGAGKSTLINILVGVHSFEKGSIWVDGKEVKFTNPKEAEAYGISIIHQELNINRHMTVAENLFLGKEITHKFPGMLNKRAMNESAKEILTDLGITHIDPNDRAGDLSVGQQQMIEIAKSLATNPRAIIMDEPTAALTEREIEVLFEVIESLRKRNVSIIYVSHRMEEIFQICDRITVLRDGEYIGTKNVKDVTFDEVVRMMVGRELGERFPERNKNIGEVIFEVENLSVSGVFENVTFKVRSGEVLGIAGLMGAGRTEILETIFGYRKKDHGEIKLFGETLEINHPRDAMNKGIAFITEDRQEKGAILEASIRENISLANMKYISNSSGIISRSKERTLIKELIHKFRVNTTNMEQQVKSLSGGNQQKVIIAKWINIEPAVLLLDEPTRGVDVGAKQEIYHIINELSAKGTAIIMVSSEMPEILGVSDRIMVVHEGTVTGMFERENVNQEKIMSAAAGEGGTL